ncbi:hypothetical protein FRX31_026831 [Thalictrum thalictroides]|uniref:Uncharacterized protein n=1 Tax=Thalictrum thalictroides TaxID=46969 RepID=A0A7J6VES0_THATH|nr:hypothetical protein FRX31_026831 [Thalictrum thalictroides]
MIQAPPIYYCVCLLLHHHLHASFAFDQGLIDEICHYHTTIDYKFCNCTLAEDPRAAATTKEGADFSQALRILLLQRITSHSVMSNVMCTEVSTMALNVSTVLPAPVQRSQPWR